MGGIDGGAETGHHKGRLAAGICLKKGLTLSSKTNEVLEKPTGFQRARSLFRQSLAILFFAPRCLDAAI